MAQYSWSGSGANRSIDPGDEYACKRLAIFSTVIASLAEVH